MRPDLIRAALALALCAALAGAAWAAGATHRVLMKDIDFAPKTIRVHVGDTVEWTNADPVAHTATATDGSWEVEAVPGGTARRTMTTAGSIAYLCRYHPNMQGEIVVAP